MKIIKPKRRVYRKLDPSFASDYVKVLRLLSRKHKTDDVEEVKGILRLLKNMSANLFYAGRGEVWIPKPNARTGRYPIIEKVPYTAVRRAIRSNTSEAVRARAWGVVASSAESFVPLFARRPGSLTEAQRRSLLAHAMVALPFVKGRHPALLGKRVPGELGVSDVGTRSIIPVQRMAPEDWEKGFTMRKFSLSEDLTKSIQRQLTRKPRVPNPTPRMPKADLKDMLKRATDLKVKLEPQRRDYAGELAVRGKQPMLKKVTRVKTHRVVPPPGAGAWKAKWDRMARQAKTDPSLNFNPKTGRWNWSNPKFTRLAKQGAPRLRPIRPRRVLSRRGKLGLAGLGVTAAAALATRRRRKQQQYTLSDVDRMCYEDGVREWLKKAKRKTGRVWKRATRWVKGEVLPTVARNVTLGVAGLAHTELGIPPTTVDLLPVQRVGLKRDLQPYPSMQLRKVVEGLQQQLVGEVDPVLRKGLEKGVSEIATELMVRRIMPGFV